MRLGAQAPGACAEFIGAIEVSKEEAGASYAGKLTEGLWLVWKDQGASKQSILLCSLGGSDDLLLEANDEHSGKTQATTRSRRSFRGRLSPRTSRRRSGWCDNLDGFPAIPRHLDRSPPLTQYVLLGPALASLVRRGAGLRSCLTMSLSGRSS